MQEFKSLIEIESSQIILIMCSISYNNLLFNIVNLAFAFLLSLSYLSYENCCDNPMSNIDLYALTVGGAK